LGRGPLGAARARLSPPGGPRACRDPSTDRLDVRPDAASRIRRRLRVDPDGARSVCAPRRGASGSRGSPGIHRGAAAIQSAIGGSARNRKLVRRPARRSADGERRSVRPTANDGRAPDPCIRDLGGGDLRRERTVGPSSNHGPRSLRAPGANYRSFACRGRQDRDSIARCGARCASRRRRALIGPAAPRLSPSRSSRGGASAAFPSWEKKLMRAATLGSPCIDRDTPIMAPLAPPSGATNSTRSGRYGPRPSRRPRVTTKKGPGAVRSAPGARCARARWPAEQSEVPGGGRAAELRGHTVCSPVVTMRSETTSGPSTLPVVGLLVAFFERATRGRE
jgi:hypothetical protein